MNRIRPTRTRRHWSSATELRDSVLAECGHQYRDLTGIDFERGWSATHHHRAETLQHQDAAARRAIRNASRTAVWDLVAETMHGPTPVVCAESMLIAAIAAFAGTLRRPPTMRFLQLHNGLRSYVLWAFGGEHPVRFEMVEPLRLSFKTRRLTDHELAILKLLIEGERLRPRHGDVAKGITVGTFIDRERRAISLARAHHGLGFEPGDRARTLEAARGGERVRLH